MDLDRDALPSLLEPSIVVVVAAAAAAAVLTLVELGRSEGNGILRLGEDTPPGPLLPPPLNNVVPGGGGGRGADDNCRL